MTQPESKPHAKNCSIGKESPEDGMPMPCDCGKEAERLSQLNRPESKPPRSNELEKEAREFDKIKQNCAREISEYAAKRPEICDFIGDVQKYAFTKLTALAAQVEERARERCAEIALDDPQQHNHPFEHQRKACLRCKIAAAIRERSRG